MPPAVRKEPDARESNRPRPAPKGRPREAPESERLEKLLRERYRMTPSEAQVAGLIAEGLNYSEIAKALEVSYHTVHSHVKAIHVKTRMNSNGKVMALIRTDLRL